MMFLSDGSIALSPATHKRYVAACAQLGVAPEDKFNWEAYYIAIGYPGAPALNEVPKVEEADER